MLGSNVPRHRLPVRAGHVGRGAFGVLLALTAPSVVGGSAAKSATATAPAFCRDRTFNGLVDQASRDELDYDGLVTLSRRFDPSASAAPPDCGNTVAYCLGVKVALATVDRAYALLGGDHPDMRGARALLMDGRAHGAPWQLLVAEGDVDAELAHQTGQLELYHDAASELQLSLNAINEQPLCGAFGEIRPEPDEIRRIRKRTQEAVMLSPRFDIARTKQGDCGGIFLDKVRDIQVEAVPVPITFEYNKADFTVEGKKAADALLVCLREKKLPAITLTGHTDSHGSDAYNMDLSARRLSVVEAFLKAGGYAGTLRLIPEGKREPFQPDDPTQHSADELDQMNRRVELREIKP